MGAFCGINIIEMKKGYIKIEFLKAYCSYKKGDATVIKKSLAIYIINGGFAKEVKAKKIIKK